MEHDLMEFGRKLVCDLLQQAGQRNGIWSYAPNRFGTSSELASVVEFGTNQLQTSSEQTPNYS